jgi:hypothetical protein
MGFPGALSAPQPRSISAFLTHDFDDESDVFIRGADSTPMTKRASAWELTPVEIQIRFVRGTRSGIRLANGGIGFIADDAVFPFI